MGYLRKGSMKIERTGETLELIELNALGQQELMDANAEGHYIAAAAITLKHGTEKWQGKSSEEIMEDLPMDLIKEISDAIIELSGLLDEDDSAKKD